MNHADLLLEIGVEELPAGAAIPMSESFASGVHDALLDAGFIAKGSDYEVYSTPRRIAVLVPQVAERQEDRETERKGPSVAAGFNDDETPTKALAGFARSCGVDVSELSRVATPKGEWFVFQSVAPGQTLSAYLSDALPAIAKQIPSPRRMRWSDGSTEFLRPVRWLTALHGADTVAIELLGQSAIGHTYGHRFHAPAELHLSEAADYLARLRDDGFVIADCEARKQLVIDQVKRCAGGSRANVTLDPELVDEVTSLVEWPVAIAGSFDERFLSLPKEALIQTMAENQRYFALFDDKGELHPGFVTVANIDSSQPDSVRSGNERVIRPRFADTLFFWDKDCQSTLESRRPGLEKVLFQKSLGSLYQKTERLQQIAGFIAERIGVSRQDCERAATLAKCDLLTETVGELAKMQGIAGSYLALADGESASVSLAIREQYLPIKSGGALPSSAEGQVLSMADKVDTLVGIFGIGQKPTGTKDPFALRRAAVGLLRILIECEHSINLKDLFNHAASTYGDGVLTAFNVDDLLEFVTERLRNYYLERGERHDVIDAVAAKGINDPHDFNRRVTAIAGFRASDAADALAAASKRINNILKKVDNPIPKTIDESCLAEPAEQNLARDLLTIESELSPQFEKGNYVEAMRSTAKLRNVVDDFFDNVMVMDENPRLRDNRLALLTRVADLCSRTADLSQLQPAG